MQQENKIIEKNDERNTRKLVEYKRKPKTSGRRSKRNLFKDTLLRKPKETRRKQHKIYNRVPRKNDNYQRNMGDTQTK